MFLLSLELKTKYSHLKIDRSSSCHTGMLLTIYRVCFVAISSSHFYEVNMLFRAICMHPTRLYKSFKSGNGTKSNIQLNLNIWRTKNDKGYCKKH